jgi:pyridoxine kinase
MNILSIQSHVSYGYVGNKAATFPLQSLGFDVWPIHTVQFSNHTGYGHWQGEVFSAEHIQAVVNGLVALDLAQQCTGILSGYLGDKSIGQVIVETVQHFKRLNPNLIYLCDPVMGHPGGKNCFVKEDIPLFFRESVLSIVDIITPNHFEAEILWGKKIHSLADLQAACTFFHTQGISIVAITRLQLPEMQTTQPEKSFSFLSLTKQSNYLGSLPHLQSETEFNGSGDLFSALLLGHFLLSRDPVSAFKQAMNTTYQILDISLQAKQRELKIIGYPYCDLAPNLIKLTPILS